MYSLQNLGLLQHPLFLPPCLLVRIGSKVVCGTCPTIKLSLRTATPFLILHACRFWLYQPIVGVQSSISDYSTIHLTGL